MLEVHLQRDVNAANKLQKDARLILRGLDAETIVNEYEKLTIK